MEQNIYNAIYKVNHAGGCGSCFYLKQYDLFVTNYHVGFFCSSGYPVIGVERSRDRTEDKRGRLSVWYAVHSD